MHNYDEPVYLISVVSKMLNIHPQTLRQYEREGLITPSRTEGRMRLYSQRDIDKVRMILRLTRDLGVNLAGVDIILRLKEKIAKLESEIETLNIEVMQYKYMEVGERKQLQNKQNIYDIDIELEVEEKR
ncbi:MAG TPA: MerR family transcriptional regulator [Campylobacterales bacterium]|nr:MerR family transcriptional regulator [Campylobacterales bacterium]HIO70385.1 MerR family transcriptional regulator [Campylobacterales bacterium]